MHTGVWEKSMIVAVVFGGVPPPGICRRQYCDNCDRRCVKSSELVASLYTEYLGIAPYL